MPPALLLAQALIEGIASLLSTQKNKSLATAGVDAELADEIAMAVLQATAQVKGATVDWTNPAAVSDYIKTLPAFTPIPDPPPAAAPAGD
jgi:hypothetical protein